MSRSASSVLLALLTSTLTACSTTATGTSSQALTGDPLTQAQWLELLDLYEEYNGAVCGKIDAITAATFDVGSWTHIEPDDPSIGRMDYWGEAPPIVSFPGEGPTYTEADVCIGYWDGWRNYTAARVVICWTGECCRIVATTCPVVSTSCQVITVSCEVHAECVDGIAN